MKKNIILFFGILIFLGAQEKSISQYTSTFEECLKDSVNPNRCMETELKYQDKKLNKSYGEARKSIQPFRRKSLKNIQKAWIKYRDEKCNFFYHKESGSGGITDVLECKLNMTMQRTKELKEIF